MCYALHGVNKAIYVNGKKYMINNFEHCICFQLTKVDTGKQNDPQKIIVLADKNYTVLLHPPQKVY